jgi:hypothetical protein
VVLIVLLLCRFLLTLSTRTVTNTLMVLGYVFSLLVLPLLLILLLLIRLPLCLGLLHVLLVEVVVVVGVVLHTILGDCLLSVVLRPLLSKC